VQQQRRTALAGEAGGVLRGAADMRCRSALKLLPLRDFSWLFAVLAVGEPPAGDLRQHATDVEWQKSNSCNVHATQITCGMSQQIARSCSTRTMVLLLACCSLVCKRTAKQGHEKEQR